METEQKSKTTAIKKPGTSGIQGQHYEIELALHFLLKGLAAKQDGKIDQFYLGCNIGCVYGFDDLVFKYVKNHNGEKIEKIILLQSKHRDADINKNNDNEKKKVSDTETNPDKHNPNKERKMKSNKEEVTLKKILANITSKGDYSIKQYFDGFNKNKLSFLTTEDAVLRGGIENCEFILFSNSRLEKGELGDCIYNIDNCEFFDWDDQRRFKFKCNETTIDLLKRPLHLEKLLQEIFDWVNSKKISRKKIIYQQYSKFIQENIIEIDGNKASFRNEFLFPTKNDILLLQEEFLKQINRENKSLNDMKKIQFSIEDRKSKIDDNQEKEFVSEWSEAEIQTFLDRFIIMFDQPNVKKLKSLNKKILKSQLCLFPVEVELYHTQLFKKLCSWWQKVDNFHYLTGKDMKLFSKLENDLSFISKCNESIKYFKNLDLMFENVNTLTKHIRENNLVLVVINDCTKIQSHAKLYQTVNEMKLNYLFFDSQSFFEHQDIILEKFSRKCDTLVITNISPVNLKYLSDKLFNVVNENRDKKLILTGSANMKLPYDFKFLEDSEIMLTNLSSQSREQFLNRTIRFQGVEVKLKEIVWSNSTKDNEMFSYLIENEDITVDIKNSNNGFIESCYIPRKLTRCEFLDKRCLKEDRLAFIFDETCIQNKEGIHLQKNVFLKEDTQLDYQKQSVHYIKREKNKLMWLKSVKNLKDIREYITDEISSMMTPEVVIKQECQFIIVSGEPGIGKSSLISYLMTNTDTKYWKYRINLAAHSNYFDNVELLNPLDFLKSACQMENFEFALFQDNVEHLGNIILYFDGFDEISPDYKEIVLELFDKLRETKIKKIFITTRLSTKEYLENHLNTLAYEIQPFTPVDQENFLKSFKKMDDRTIKTILNIFTEAINDQMKKFVSVPLQLKMLAEIYEEYTFEDLNLYKIYRRFFEKKICEILYEEKMGLDSKHPASKRKISESIESSVKQYEKLAALSLFEKQLPSILSQEKIKKIKKILDKKVINGTDESGIVNYVHNGKVIFVHQTFAEYFVASFLIRVFKKNISINEFVNSINFFESSQSVLRIFFDYGLCEKQKLCTAVLSKDLLKLEELLSSADVSERDEGGRHPLHLAAAHNLENVAEILIKNGADVQAEDSIMCWTPISYGDACQHLGILEMFLKHGVDPNRMYKTIKNLDVPRNSTGNTALHLAAECGYYELLKFLMTITPDPFEIQNNLGQTILHRAAVGGKSDMIKFLIENGANPISADIHGNTLLHYAARLRQVEMLKYLIEETKSPFTVKSNVGGTILHEAVVGGNIDMIKYLIKNGAVPLEADNDGDTTLHYAAEFRHLEVLKYFMDQTTNSCDIKNKFDRTILHCAAVGGNIDIVKYLVENQADLMAKDKFGNTPLHSTAEFGQVAVLKYLMDVTKDSLTIKNLHGRTILHLAAIGRDLEIIKYLIDNKANPMSGDDNGDTPIHLTAEFGHVTVMKYLLEGTKDLFSIKNKRGQGILHRAVVGGKIDMIEYLIENRADNDGNTSLHLAAEFGHVAVFKYLADNADNPLIVKNCEGQTVLHWAAVGGKIDMIKYLIENGADTTLVDANGNTWLHLIAHYGHLEVLKYFKNIVKNSLLIKNNHGYTIFHRAIVCGKMDLIKYLIENGADPFTVNNDGNTSLHLIAEFGHVAIFKFLAENINNPLITKNNYGQTVLHRAAIGGKVNMIKYLIENGADPMLADMNGNTSLHLIAYFGHLEALKYFKEIDINFLFVKKNLGNTILHRVNDFGKIDLIKYFIEHQPNPTVRNEINFTNKRQTLLHNSAASGKMDVIRYLIECGANPLAVDMEGDSSIQYAAEMGHITVLEYLLSITSKSIDLTNENGETLLHHAVMYGRMEMIEYLLNRGLDPMATDNVGNTILHFGAGCGDVSIFEYLLTLTSLPINVSNNNGKTPWHRAVEKNKFHMIEYLTINGAAQQ